MKPAGIPIKDLDKIILEIDELEALRLCDGCDFSQAEAGKRMGVSRGTVQRLVASGRNKLIRAIIECQSLVVNAEEEVS